MADSDFAASFPPSSIAISHELGGALEEVARQLDIPFLDAAKVTLPAGQAFSGSSFRFRPASSSSGAL